VRADICAAPFVYVAGVAELTLTDTVQVDAPARVAQLIESVPLAPTASGH